MSNYITGTSNYPANYDVVPIGTGTNATVSFVLDQLRDPITGIITQTGNIVVAEAINNIYTIVQAVQGTLGVNPQDIFATVAARMNYLQYSGAGAFVPLSGGSMHGPLTLAGTGTWASLNTNYINSSGGIWKDSSSISVAATGSVAINGSGGVAMTSTNSNISNTSNGFIVNSKVTTINGSGSVNISGGTILLTATGNTYSDGSLLPYETSLYNLGSTGNVWNNLYVNNIVSTGTNLPYVLKAGDTMSGALGLNSIVNANNTGSISVLAVNSNNIDLRTNGGALILEGWDAPSSTSSWIGIGYTGIAIHNDQYGATFPIGLYSPSAGIQTLGTITPQGSGVDNIGSAAHPYGTIYATTLNANIAGVVKTTGSSMTGSLTMGSGNSFVVTSGTVSTAVSGTSTIGASGVPFANVYTNQINGRTPGNYAFNETLAVATGVLGSTRAFSFTYPPITGNAMVFVSGVLLTPGLQYSITSNILTITGSMYTPTTAPVAGFYLY